MSQLSREQKPAPEAEIRSRVFEGDRSLWIIFTVLLVISILVVYSSTAKMTYDTAANMSLFDALQKQVMYVMLSIMAIFVTHKIHYKIYMRWTYVAYILCVLLTVAVYVVGEKTNDAARWLSIGPIKFQPSEALKIATILMLARAMESRQAVIDTLKIIPTSFKFRSPEQLEIIKKNTIPLLGPVLLSCAVIAPAHTSSALIVFIASIIMLYIGRVNLKEIAKFFMVICAVGVLGLGGMELLGMGRLNTAMARLEKWGNEWVGDSTAKSISEISDTQRALIAIHEGGLVGEGAGQSSSRVLVVHPESDYAYAFFVSEYGIIFGLILMLLYIWIFFRAMDIGQKCTTPFPTLMTLGLGLLITGQAILHMFVQVNILPETGQTLPFISRGGSSLILTTVALGMIISVSRTNQNRVKQR
ncbi:MAG: FtsW/RodA/SpoVE family cell cycle protein [Alistipes sp.]|nr:FtsW/RodA/SpoVE family cell cycle protein [Alistipes sp.]